MTPILEPTGKSLKQLLDLSGKSAVVTGGEVGIGLGIARRLAEAGVLVTIAESNSDAAEVSANGLCDEGWRVQAVRGDVGSARDAQRMVEAAVKPYGSLDIWVNNAGTR